MNKEDMNLQEHKERSMKGFKRRKEMGESYNYSEISKNNRNKKKTFIKKKRKFWFSQGNVLPPPLFSVWWGILLLCYFVSFKRGFDYVIQASSVFVISCLSLPNAGITGKYHHVWTNKITMPV